MGNIIVLVYLTIALASFIGVLRSGRAAGWLLIGTGIILLGYAGNGFYIIHANNNVFPGSVNYYGLVSAIPAGILLLLVGGLTFCLRLCLRKYASRRARAGTVSLKIPGLCRFGRVGFLMGLATGFMAVCLD